MSYTIIAAAARGAAPFIPRPAASPPLRHPITIPIPIPIQRKPSHTA